MEKHKLPFFTYIVEDGCWRIRVFQPLHHQLTQQDGNTCEGTTTDTWCGIRRCRDERKGRNRWNEEGRRTWIMGGFLKHVLDNVTLTMAHLKKKTKNGAKGVERKEPREDWEVKVRGDKKNKRNRGKHLDGGNLGEGTFRCGLGHSCQKWKNRRSHGSGRKRDGPTQDLPNTSSGNTTKWRTCGPREAK